jgi:hypothetical protein
MSAYLDKDALLKFAEEATAKVNEEGVNYASEDEINFFLAGVEDIIECVEEGRFDADLPS